MDVFTALGRIGFSIGKISGNREHYLDADDIRIVLSRLPVGLWASLRAVHFNDQSRGGRILGYVTRGHREIAICALPSQIRLARWMEFSRGCNNRRTSPREFGADRGRPWPRVAVRRFLLYDVFLHELGHCSDPTKRYAKERKAQEFADYWRKELWSKPFDHPAPEHHAPAEAELGAVNCRQE